jgi:hypothetical protein
MGSSTHSKNKGINVMVVNLWQGRLTEEETDVHRTVEAAQRRDVCDICAQSM